MASLINTIYGLPPTGFTRTRPVEVLAVGISRSGTDSLRAALVQLGIAPCYHGYESDAHPNALPVFCDLHLRKARGERLTAKELDDVFGPYVGITDLPAAVFAEDLIREHPEAKVILNTRDVDKWYKSFDSTLMVYCDSRGLDWLRSYFHAELFWMRRYVSRIGIPVFFQGSFRKNGKRVYEEHTALIKGLNLPKERFLEWTPTDGWEPLCKFLDKPVPSEPFPSGNIPAEWEERIASANVRRNALADRNMMLVGGALIGVIAVVSYTVANPRALSSYRNVVGSFMSQLSNKVQ